MLRVGLWVTSPEGICCTGCRSPDAEVATDTRWGMDTIPVTGHDRGLKTIMGTGIPNREDSRPSAVSAPATQVSTDSTMLWAANVVTRSARELGRGQQLVDGDGGGIGGCPAQGIVELGEQYAAPGLGQLLLYVEGPTGQCTAQLGHLLGRHQGVLGPGVSPLERGPNRIAADRVPLKLAGDQREVRVPGATAPRRASK